MFSLYFYCFFKVLYFFSLNFSRVRTYNIAFLLSFYIAFLIVSFILLLALSFSTFLGWWISQYLCDQCGALLSPQLFAELCMFSSLLLLKFPSSHVVLVSWLVSLGSSSEFEKDFWTLLKPGIILLLYVLCKCMVNFALLTLAIFPFPCIYIYK